jgi:hypothetical protein
MALRGIIQHATDEVSETRGKLQNDDFQNVRPPPDVIMGIKSRTLRREVDVLRLREEGKFS